MSTFDPAAALELLSAGDLEVLGRLVDASNATLLCTVTTDAVEARCVYKPIAGERPLWDFPDGTLAGREVAAFLLAEAFGGNLVPPTVLRDGPFGPGMCQLWVETDPQEVLVDVVEPADVPPGWLHVLDAQGPRGRDVVLAHADDERLRRMAIFDVVVNNADRKGGHILPGPDGVVRGVDHGVAFHVEPKLRTVLWGFAGQQLTSAERAQLEVVRAQLADRLGAELTGCLTRREVTACQRRVDRLLRDGCLPYPQDDWPTIPWPPF